MTFFFIFGIFFFYLGSQNEDITKNFKFIEVMDFQKYRPKQPKYLFNKL